MNTFNTYQEAKIANPESEIYIHTGEFLPSKNICPSPITYEARGFKICNPADYCMTVEKFLRDGHKFVDSDSFIDQDGRAELIGDGNFFNVNGANDPQIDDDKRYILRAAALEQPKQEVDKSKMKDISALKWLDTSSLVAALGCVRTDIDGEVITISVCEGEQPKHTKVEYVKVEFEDVWKYLGLNASGVYQRLSDGDYSKLNHVDDLYTYKDELFTKVVTELTERELVIEQACKLIPTTAEEDIKIIGKLYDLGMLKLQNEG